MATAKKKSVSIMPTFSRVPLSPVDTPCTPDKNAMLRRDRPSCRPCIPASPQPPTLTPCAPAPNASRPVPEQQQHSGLLPPALCTCCSHADANLPGAQFKIEPFKHPLKVDPLYGGEHDCSSLVRAMCTKTATAERNKLQCNFGEEMAVSM